MAIGTGIFLSAIFLGCVFLYIKSENKPKFRRYVLLSLGTPLAIGLIVFLYIVIDEKFEKRTDTSQQGKEASKFPTHMKGLKLGETIANLQFEHGKFTALPPHDGYKTYFANNGVVIYEKSGVAERLVWYCPENPFSDLTFFHQIQCGVGSKQVLDTYGKSAVKILCSDVHPDRRVYFIEDKKIRMILEGNRVSQIEFSTVPFPEFKVFTKPC